MSPFQRQFPTSVIADYARQYQTEHPELAQNKGGADIPAREAEPGPCGADAPAREAEPSPCGADIPVREAEASAVVQPEALAALVGSQRNDFSGATQNQPQSGERTQPAAQAVG